MKNFLHSLRKDIPLLLIITCAFLAGIYFYPGLPDRVPSHWNFAGEVDGYSSRFWGAFGIPLLVLGMLLFFEVLPLIDPKKENYQKFNKAFNVFKYAISLLLLGLYLVVLLAAKGYPVNVGLVVPLGMSILFIVMGNYLTTIRHNYFIGVRTPWTLASEEVWQKTHRVMGRLWVVSGVLSLISLVVNAKVGGIVFFVTIIGSSIFSCFYSWWYFQRLQRS